MGITMNEIARICKVSRGTVDRVLNNRGSVNEETRKRILNTVEEYGYTKNYIASSLATGRSRSVGIIVFNLNNRFFTETVSAAQRTFLKSGLFAYICLSDKDKRLERSLINDLVLRKADGILLLPINDSPDFTRHINRLSVPVVSIANRLDAVHYIGADGIAAVCRGMEHFYKRGYRTVHFVCPPIRNLGKENLYSQVNRLEGYRKYMAEHPDMDGVEIITEDYMDRIFELAARSRERCGFFCSSDHYALKIFQAARDRKIDIPGRFALMGFDGVDNVLTYLEKKMTTVLYPAAQIGVAAAEMLAGLIDQKEQPREVLLECPLLSGETV